MSDKEADQDNKVVKGLKLALDEVMKIKKADEDERQSANIHEKAYWRWAIQTASQIEAAIRSLISREPQGSSEASESTTQQLEAAYKCIGNLQNLVVDVHYLISRGHSETAMHRINEAKDNGWEKIGWRALYELGGLGHEAKSGLETKTPVLVKPKDTPFRRY